MHVSRLFFLIHCPSPDLDLHSRDTELFEQVIIHTVNAHFKQLLQVEIFAIFAAHLSDETRRDVVDAQFGQLVTGEFFESHFTQLAHELWGHVMDAQLHEFVHVQIGEPGFAHGPDEVG